MYGEKRKIGFGLSFFISLLNVIIGLIAVLCSKKKGTVPHERNNRKYGGNIMKIAGCIFVAIGVLAFIGAAWAEHSTLGPSFGLALGIALVYLDREKSRK